MRALNWTFAILSLVVPPALLFAWIEIDLRNGGGFGSLLLMLLSLFIVVIGLVPGALVMIAVIKARGRAKMLAYLIAAPLVWIETLPTAFTFSDFGDTRSASYLEEPLGYSPEEALQAFTIAMPLLLVGWILLYALAIVALVRTLRAVKVTRVGPPRGGPFLPNQQVPHPDARPSAGFPANRGGTPPPWE